MALLLCTGLAACSGRNETSQISADASVSEQTSQASTAKEDLKDPIAQMLNYLDGTSGFSKESLIKQMEHDGYDALDVEAAMNRITIDWNEQAQKAATAYKDVDNYSTDELKDLLKNEGFTDEQAAYGAEYAGE